jgi:hypothetical protein
MDYSLRLLHETCCSYRAGTIRLCTESAEGSSAICYIGCRTEHKLRIHLAGDHGMTIRHTARVPGLVIGPQYRSFWCGFCQKAVFVEEGELLELCNWMSVREKHIF